MSFLCLFLYSLWFSSLLSFITSFLPLSCRKPTYHPYSLSHMTPVNLQKSATGSLSPADVRFLAVCSSVQNKYFAIRVKYVSDSCRG